MTFSTLGQFISDEVCPKEAASHGSVSICRCTVSTNCVYWQWLFKVVPSSCSNILHRLMLIFNPVQPEGLKLKSIHCTPLPLTCRDFLGTSDDMAVNVEIPKSLAIGHWQMFLQFYTEWWNYSHPAHWVCAFHLQSSVSYLLQMNLFTCGMSQWVIFQQHTATPADFLEEFISSWWDKIMNCFCFNLNWMSKCLF